MYVIKEHMNSCEVDEDMIRNEYDKDTCSWLSARDKDEDKDL